MKKEQIDTRFEIDPSGVVRAASSVANWPLVATFEEQDPFCRGMHGMLPTAHVGCNN